MVETAIPGLIVIAVFGGMFTGAAPKAACYSVSSGGTIVFVANIVGAFTGDDAEEADDAEQLREDGKLPTTFDKSDVSDKSDKSDLFDAQPESAISIGRIGRIGHIGRR